MFLKERWLTRIQNWRVNFSIALNGFSASNKPKLSTSPGAHENTPFNLSHSRPPVRVAVKRLIWMIMHRKAVKGNWEVYFRKVEWIYSLFPIFKKKNSNALKWLGKMASPIKVFWELFKTHSLCQSSVQKHKKIDIIFELLLYIKHHIRHGGDKDSNECIIIQWEERLKI